MPAEDYDVAEFIGRGSFGEVYRGVEKTSGSHYAFKVLNLEGPHIEDVIKEIHFLVKLRLPYITRHIELFVKDTSLWMVLEYCGGGLCADLLRAYTVLPENVAGCITASVLRGLQYLHGQGQVHRDIKLANILLTDSGHVKLADLGVSGEITATCTKRNTMVGTPYWMAPEVISRSNTGYNGKADIWSVGITVVELVCGKPPLAHLPPMKALFEIARLRPPALDSSHGANARDFVRYCLQRNPHKRPHAGKLLHHKFVSGSNGGELQGLLAHKKLKEAIKPKKAPPKKPQPAPPASIRWDLSTREMGTGPQFHRQFADQLVEALGRVWARATTPEAKAAVARIRQYVLEAEEENVGLCHAVLEELFS